ncbi:hypothetical protein CEXT_165111 [Caerostris extrusa]|uniref:Uncharacterized protein n=1 Tax=Caerostris extrusa TaxID=172846 RepID=A0AAV4WU23_CAEEX|nr:hypothetical protein CEXT_165111 [Caerostris extrusa]
MRKLNNTHFEWEKNPKTKQQNKIEKPGRVILKKVHSPGNILCKSKTTLEDRKHCWEAFSSNRRTIKPDHTSNILLEKKITVASFANPPFAVTCL